MANYKSIYMSYMDRNGIKYTEMNDTVVKVVYTGDNLKSIVVYVFFDKDGDPLVTFKCWDIATFKDDKWTDGITVCNMLNQKYRWVKFYVGEDGDINAQIDAVIDEMTCGEECSHLVRRVVNIVDEGYPVIMKALWA